MKISHFFLLALLATLYLAMTSCNKEKDPETFSEEEAIQTAEDVMNMDIYSTQTGGEMDEFANGSGGGSCPEVTITQEDGNGFTRRTILIDFGSMGCEGPNGNFYTGSYWTDDSLLWVVGNLDHISRNQTFTDLTVNGLEMDGTMIDVIQLCHCGEDSLLWFKSNTDLFFSYPNGQTSQFNGVETFTYLQGGATPLNNLDDVLSITGQASGVTRNGKVFNMVITEPLIKEGNCPWITQGKFYVEFDGLTDKLILNYGNGECDQFATLTLPDGTTKQVKAGKWW